MTKEELKLEFSIECTTLDDKGNTVVKGTPMDIINWIAHKFSLSDVSCPYLKFEPKLICSRCGGIQEHEEWCNEYGG